MRIVTGLSASGFVLLGCLAAQAQTAPPDIVSMERYNVTANSAIIRWETYPAATSQVEYGTTLDYGSLTTEDPALVDSHSVPLTGLLPGTVYHFRARSRAAPGAPQALSENYMFTTLRDPMVNAITMGPVRTARGTIHSIGFEWDLAGDDNHNATGRVRYRIQGSNAPWRESFLLRIDYRGWYGNRVEQAYRHFNMLAGSLMFLQPGTPYEIELIASDPDGGGETRSLTVATRRVPERAPDTNVFHVVPGNGGGTGSAADPFRGIAAAETAAQPGTLFLLHAGEYAGHILTRSGAAGQYIVWTAAGDGPAILRSGLFFEGNHLWFEGLTFEPTDAGAPYGLKASGNGGAGKENIVIVRNTFRNCRYAISDPSTGDWDGDLALLDRYWYVADNVMEGGPRTEYGLRMHDMADSDIAYNRISECRLGGDAIAVRGSTNVDIYGNDIRDIEDDGIEPDHSYANMRIWRNRIVGAPYSFVSFQPMLCSPWYIVGNEFVGVEVWSQILKTNVNDRSVIVNNTFVTYGFSAQNWAAILLRSYSRNNLWINDYTPPPGYPPGTLWQGHGDTFPDQESGSGGQSVADWKSDLDYDGFDWAQAPLAFYWQNASGVWVEYGDLASFAAALGIEAHGVRVRKQELFDIDPRAYVSERFSTSRLSLKAGCNAIDAGQAVPNLTDDLVGIAPDLGAYELGGAPRHYGPRTPTEPAPEHRRHRSRCGLLGAEAVLLVAIACLLRRRRCALPDRD